MVAAVDMSFENCGFNYGSYLLVVPEKGSGLHLVSCRTMSKEIIFDIL